MMQVTVGLAHFVEQGWAPALWRASWQGALAIILIWGLCALLPRIPPATRSWLWRGVYLKIVLALFLTSQLVLPILTVPDSSASTAPAGPMQHVSSSPISLQRVPIAHAIPVHPVFITAHASPLAPLSGPLVLLFLLWCAGVCWCGGSMFRQARQLHAFRRTCHPVADEAVLAMLSALCRQLHIARQPKLAQGAVLSPLVFSGVTPLIVLPAGVLEAPDYSEIHLMLAHELAHVQRRDLCWNWLAFLCKAVFCFHPLLLLAQREWNLAQEMASDAIAIAASQRPAHVYGLMLLRTVASRRQSSYAYAGIGLAESHISLKRRLQAMKEQTGKRRTVILIGILAIIIGVLCLLPWGFVRRHEARSIKPVTNKGGNISGLRYDAEASVPLMNKGLDNNAIPGYRSAQSGLAIDSHGVLYDIDENKPALRKISPTGDEIARWRLPNCGSDVTVDGHDRIDVLSNGVFQYNTNGVLIKQWKLDQDPSNPGIYRAITADANGKIYVLDDKNPVSVVTIAPDNTIARWQVPDVTPTKYRTDGYETALMSIAVDTTGIVYLGDGAGDRIVKASLGSDQLTVVSKTQHHPYYQCFPSRLAIGANGLIYSAQPERIDVCTPAGKLVKRVNYPGVQVVAVDHAGYIYTVVGDNRLLKFPPVTVPEK
jgi:beta-lactamase regulating signal transducer with metallopeptidase domain